MVFAEVCQTNLIPPLRNFPVAQGPSDLFSPLQQIRNQFVEPVVTQAEEDFSFVKVLVVNNEKGGVGKSTIAVHLAWYFAEHRKRVLFIDLDPQSNGTTTLSAQIREPEAAAFFARSVAVPPLSAPGIRVAPATPALRGILTVDGKIIQQFCSNLKDASQSYDVAVIDTPPTFGVRNLAALSSWPFRVGADRPRRLRNRRDRDAFEEYCRREAEVQS